MSVRRLNSVARGNIASVSGVPWATVNRVNTVLAEPLPSWFVYDGTNDGPALASGLTVLGIDNQCGICRLSTSLNTFLLNHYTNGSNGFPVNFQAINHDPTTDTLTLGPSSTAGAYGGGLSRTKFPCLGLEDRWAVAVAATNSTLQGIGIHLIEQVDANTLVTQVTQTMFTTNNTLSAKSGFGGPTMVRLEANKFAVCFVDFGTGELVASLYEYTTTPSGTLQLLDQKRYTPTGFTFSTFALSLDPSGDMMWAAMGDGPSVGQTSIVVGDIRRSGDVLTFGGEYNIGVGTGGRTGYAASIVHWKDNQHVVANRSVGGSAGEDGFYAVMTLPAGSGAPTFNNRTILVTASPPTYSGGGPADVVQLEGELFMGLLQQDKVSSPARRSLILANTANNLFSPYATVEDTSSVLTNLRGIEGFKFAQDGLLQQYNDSGNQLYFKVIRPGSSANQILNTTLTAGTGSGIVGYSYQAAIGAMGDNDLEHSFLVAGIADSSGSFLFQIRPLGLPDNDDESWRFLVIRGVTDPTFLARLDRASRTGYADIGWNTQWSFAGEIGLVDGHEYNIEVYNSGDVSWLESAHIITAGAGLTQTFRGYDNTGVGSIQDLTPRPPGQHVARIGDFYGLNRTDVGLGPAIQPDTNAAFYRCQVFDRAAIPAANSGDNLLRTSRSTYVSNSGGETFWIYNGLRYECQSGRNYGVVFRNP